MYLAVRILFRVNCCFGCPSSSWSSRGNGRLKYNCLGPGPSPVPSTALSAFCASSTGCPPTGCEMSVPPDVLFFSLAIPLLCFLPINERRFTELLLTVNFRVAHLDLCIEISGPAASAASPSGDVMMVGSRASARSPYDARQAQPTSARSRFQSTSIKLVFEPSRLCRRVGSIRRGLSSEMRRDSEAVLRSICVAPPRLQ